MQVDKSINSIMQLVANNNDNGKPRKPRPRPQKNTNCPNGDSFCGMNIVNCMQMV